MAKLNWNNLTKDERRRYMQLQVSGSGHYDRSGYLPDDCGECGACGQPILGTGWCNSCYDEWKQLSDKLASQAQGLVQGGMMSEIDRVREEIARQICQSENWDWEGLGETPKCFMQPTRSDFYHRADQILAIEGLAIVDRDAEDITDDLYEGLHEIEQNEGIRIDSKAFIADLLAGIVVRAGWVKEIMQTVVGGKSKKQASP